MPEHVEGSVVATAAGPGDYTITTNYNRTPLNPGLYDGPYLITGYDSGAQIVLEPNPHWAGHEPGFRRIVLRHIENTAALQANLLSGDVDMVAGGSRHAEHRHCAVSLQHHDIDRKSCAMR